MALFFIIKVKGEARPIIQLLNTQFTKNGFIKTLYQDYGDFIGEYYQATHNTRFDHAIFTADEINAMEVAVHYFDDINAKQIAEKNQGKKGWISDISIAPFIRVPVRFLKAAFKAISPDSNLFLESKINSRQYT